MAPRAGALQEETQIVAPLLDKKTAPTPYYSLEKAPLPKIFGMIPSAPLLPEPEP